MANSTGGLFHTMLTAATEAAEHPSFRNAFLDRIYWDYKPVVAIPNQGLTVTIPTVSEGDVSDIGGGPLTPTDTAHGTASISLDKHFSSSFVIRNWDEIRTPADLKKKYISPRFEALKRKMNRSIAQLVTVANFPNYTLVNGVTDGVFARSEIGTAWSSLTNAGVPTDDADNMSLITNVAAYAGMASSTAFTSEAVVGLPRRRGGDSAGATPPPVRRSGHLRPAHRRFQRRQGTGHPDAQVRHRGRDRQPAFRRKRGR